MVDFLSRAWHLTDDKTIAHFNSNFPQPKPWRLCLLCKPMNLSLILALSSKQCPMLLLLHTPPVRLHIGSSGVHSALLTTSTPFSKLSLTESPTCRSSLPDKEMVEFLPVADSLRLKQFLTPSFPLHRNSHGWGLRTPRKRHMMWLIIVFNLNCDNLKRTTLRPCFSSRSPSHWSFMLSSLSTGPIQHRNEKRWPIWCVLPFPFAFAPESILGQRQMIRPLLLTMSPCSSEWGAFITSIPPNLNC